MSMEVNIYNAAQALPLCREELFTQVVCQRTYGEITNVWQFPGHLFISTDGGRKLFTFDCKPINCQQDFDSGCLDKPALHPPIVAIVTVTQDIAILVYKSSHAQVYKFGANSSWSFVEEFSLSPSIGSVEVDVLGVAQLESTKSLVWCEKQQSSPLLPSSPSSMAQNTYRIMKRDFLEGFHAAVLKKQNEPEVLLYNCPPCDVFALSKDTLFITSKYSKERLTAHLIFNCTANCWRLHVGDEAMEVPQTSSPAGLDFSQIILTHLSLLVKSQPGQGDLGVKPDPPNNQIAVLSSSGQLELFHHMQVRGDSKIGRSSIDVSDVFKNIGMPERNLWFLSNRHLGVVSRHSVHIIGLAERQILCSCEGLTFPQDVILSTTPVSMAWVLTANDLLLVQASDNPTKTAYSSPDDIPNDDMLHTYTVRLAHLHQMKLNAYNINIIEELKTLKEKWTDVKSKESFSRMSKSIVPCIEEYWKLENISNSLSDLKIESQAQEDNLVEKLLESSGMSGDHRQATLIWLSQAHPEALLKHLCQGINIDNAELNEDEIGSWQGMLGLDGENLTNFECVCRLLFLLHPHKLYTFVQCAESASQHSIGVSAFIRKKQLLGYYKTACECLPETHSSSNPREAALVKAKLILASGMENKEERSLKYLLEHGLWSEAVSFVKEQEHNDSMLPSYLYITVTALAQSQVLSDYVTDLFSIMPSWKSFMFFAKVAMQRPEIRQQQLSTSTCDVFANGPGHVSLGSVKQSLLKLVKEMEAQK